MATQVSLNDGAVASAGALAIQTNGTTQAVSISTGQVATLAQNPILTSGTANGVAYLNGSKAVTSGSTLTWNASSFGIGTTPLTNKLAVVGDTTNYGILSSNPSGYGAINIRSNTITAQTWSFIANDNGANSDLLLYGGSSAGTKLVIDSSGNLGLGVTPSAWNSNWRAFQFGTGGSLSNAISQSSLVELGGNFYQDTGGTERYIASSTANKYRQYAGVHSWYTAPSGTAGNAITFTQAMTLTAGGALFVGTTAAQLDGSSQMVVLNSSATVAEFTASSGTATQAVLRSWNTATSGDNLFQTFHTDAGATQRGSITYNRAGGLVMYNQTSDYRAKDITGPVTGSGALIDSVPVYMGKMKDATQERPMFIAHETPAYAHVGEKDAVDADGKPVYQQMDASALVPVMWAEIQSLRKRLAAAGI